MVSPQLLSRIGRRMRRAWLGLSPKQFNEREFWREELTKIVLWYRGKLKELYGCPAPARAQRAHDRNTRLAALKTWYRTIVQSPRGYTGRLMLPPAYFEGQKLLDIGSGPLGAPGVFTGCEIWCLDPLTDVYRDLGYPLDAYDPRLHYVCAPAEHLPFPDGAMDAVISNNAIDHVDDFSRTASEIARVLRPGGIIRMEVHYHPPTSCEPWQLNDDIMTSHYGPLGARKLLQRPLKEIYPNRTDNKVVTIWGNTSEIYRGRSDPTA